MTAQPSPIPADPADLGFVTIDGAMWIDPHDRSSLEQAGLTGFDAVMATKRGHCRRVMHDRENWRIDIPWTGGRPRVAYLKKHRARTLSSWLRAKLGLAPAVSAAETEARNIARLTRDRIDVMRLMAYGWKSSRDRLLESFVIAEDLEGHRELQDFLRLRFPAVSPTSTRGRDRDLIELIHTLADFTHRFHAAGYNHRDFFCGHLFVKEPERGRFEIRLIDLQRVQHRRRFRRRWIVKDLAQLAWSLPGQQITCSQHMAFIRRYLGVGKLAAHHKRLIREVLAKQQMMERRLGPPRYE